MESPTESGGVARTAMMRRGGFPPAAVRGGGSSCSLPLSGEAGFWNLERWWWGGGAGFSFSSGPRDVGAGSDGCGGANEKVSSGRMRPKF
jgi:hypothetical protein